ncbi:MAG TPA: DUF305 domain-containing protein [Mycobacterium sp.]
MRRRLLAIGAAAVATLTTLTGCSGSSPEAGTSPAGTTTSAAAQPHNQADAMFAHHMIPHHQQAIEMSDIVLGKQGIDPRVVTLANQIKAAQGPEIQQMQSWLSQWGEPTMMPMPSSMMPGHDMGDMPGTSGMMSAEDMAALKNAQGVEASKLFLTHMIAHHQGAIAMAQDEIKSGQYPPAIAMSQSIVTSQQKEIDEMQAILASL